MKSLHDRDRQIDRSQRIEKIGPVVAYPFRGLSDVLVTAVVEY